MNTLSLLSNDAKYFDDTSNRLADVRTHLDSKDISLKLDAMKTLLAMISIGRDVSNYFPDVVKNIHIDDAHVKKLVYIYLIHYSEDNNDLALLSVNTLQKELLHTSPQIRANAIKAMSSIRIHIVVPLIILALKSTVNDVSTYVRRATASAIPKVYKCDPTQSTYDECIELITELLNNTEPTVLGSTLYAYSQICPDNVNILHKHIRKICHLLADFDEWGQIIAVDILLKYGRTQFIDPNLHFNHTKDQLTLYNKNNNNNQGNNQNDNALDTDSIHSSTHNTSHHTNPYNQSPQHKHKSTRFYSDDESGASSGTDTDTSTIKHKSATVVRHQATMKSTGKQLQQLDDDHRLLLKQSAQLLYSTNAGVTIAVTNLYMYLAPRNEIDIVIQPLIRALRSKRYIQYTVLSVINTLSSYPYNAQLFHEYITEFYIFVTDPLYTRETKLDILYNIANADNINIILSELLYYVYDQSIEFVCCTINTLNRLANKLPSITERVIEWLMKLMKQSYQSHIIAQSVVGITQLLQLQSNIDTSTTIYRLAKLLKYVHSPTARTSIIWIIGEYHSVVHELLPDILRILCRTFKSEDDTVKLQILNLSVKLYIHYSTDQHINVLFRYVMELCRYDINYDIRDRTRLLRALLYKRKSMKSNDNNNNDNTNNVLHTSSNNDNHIAQQVKQRFKQCLVVSKPAPQLMSPFTGRHQYQLGTISHLFNQKLPGYIELAEHPDINHIPDVNTRTPQSQMNTTNNNARRVIRRQRNTSDSDDSRSDSESIVPDNEFSEFGSETESDTSDNNHGGNNESINNKPKHKSSLHATLQRHGKSGVNDYNDHEFVSSDDESPHHHHSIAPDTTQSKSDKSATGKPNRSTNQYNKSIKSAGKQSSHNPQSNPPPSAMTYDILDLNSLNDSLIDSTRHQQQQLQRKSDADELNISIPEYQQPDTTSLISQTVNQLDNNIHNNSSHPLNASPSEPIQSLSGYTSPVHSEKFILLNPVTSGGLSIQYQFVRKPSMYGTQFNVVDLILTNQSNNQFEHIRFDTSDAYTDDIRGLDQSIHKLPMNEQYTIKIHIDCNGKQDTIPITIHASHGTFHCKLSPIITELIQPTLISHHKFDQIRRRISGGFSEHTSNMLNITSIQQAVQSIYNACNVIGLQQNNTNNNVYRFAGCKLSDSTPLLIQLSIDDTGHTAPYKCTVTVYMDDMLNGGHVLSTIVKSINNNASV